MVTQPLTTFVGRAKELSEIATLLADPSCRLLTLVGPGGVGKTRLALEATYQMDCRDGVFFVPLQPLTTVDQVVPAIMNLLHLRPDEGIDPKQALLDYLQDADLLLILDNLEHLLEASDLVAEILDNASQAKLLATSREPLNLQGEWLREITGLNYPRNDEDAVNTQYSALQLFAERARRLKADFSLEAEYQQVVRICSLVDGLPLALELAAGWLTALSCKAIAQEIQHSLDVLATNQRNIHKRHQSMRAVFDHSWRLLSESERAVMRRLAIFRGGCTREAAEKVAEVPLMMLAGLVEKSLVRHNTETDRYDMQELLRQYAQEQLMMVGDFEKAREAHHTYFSQWLPMMTSAAYRGTAGEKTWERINDDFGNVRAAWMWAVEYQDDESLMNMAQPIFAHAAANAQCFETLDLYEAARAMLAKRQGDAGRYVRAQMLAYLGMCHGALLHWQTYELYMQQAYELVREQGHPTLIGFVTLSLSLIYLYSHRIPEAIQIVTDFMDAYRDQYLRGLHGSLLMQLADLNLLTGHGDLSHQLLQESLTLFRDLDDPNAMGDAYHGLAYWALHMGQWHQAEFYLSECRQRWLEIHNLKGMNWHQSSLAQLLIAQGQFDSARQIAESVYMKAKKSELLSLVKNRALSLTTLSLLADAQADYQVGYKQANDALVFAERAQDLGIITAVNFALGWSLMSRGDAAQAMVYFQNHLATSLKWKATGNILYAIGGMARILAHQGEAIRVIELLGLIFTHPNSPVGYFQNYPPFEALRNRLEAEVGAEAYKTAWTRGMQRDVEQVASELMRAISTPTNDHNPIDPFTEREREVLRLVVDGLSNTQIAEKLFVSVGTVKTHVHNIYGKLNVEGRFQAIARVRELRLI